MECVNLESITKSFSKADDMLIIFLQVYKRSGISKWKLDNISKEKDIQCKENLLKQTVLPPKNESKTFTRIIYIITFEFIMLGLFGRRGGPPITVISLEVYINMDKNVGPFMLKRLQ